MRLDEISLHKDVKIVSLAHSDYMNQRLLDLGFVKGAMVSCVQESLCKDPRAYQICGAIIALRNEDAHKIFVEEVVDE